VDSEQDVDELVIFLKNPDRNHPVVVFSVPKNSQNPNETIILIKPFMRKTTGFVHTVVITSNGAFILTKHLGNEFSVFCKAIRTYNPGLDPDSSLPTDHPLAKAVRIASWSTKKGSSFTDFLVEQKLCIIRLRDFLEKEQPFFQNFKILSKQQGHENASSAGKMDSGLLLAERK